MLLGKAFILLNSIHNPKQTNKMDTEKNQGPDWGLEELSLLGLVRYARPHQATGLTQSLSQAGHAQLGCL